MKMVHYLFMIGKDVKILKRKINGGCQNQCINHLPDTNFWHYSLQLNTYKAILEDKYGVKITFIFGMFAS